MWNEKGSSCWWDWYVSGRINMLATQGYIVSVIGRNPDRMERLKRRFPEGSLLTPLLIDYKNVEGLKVALKKEGPYSLVVAWVHSIADEAIHTIVKENICYEGEWSFYHVLGSNRDLKETKDSIFFPEACRYHQVQLGFILEKGSSRWLTNDEISNGVIDAIQMRRFTNNVGTVEPWESRPTW